MILYIKMAEDSVKFKQNVLIFHIKSVVEKVYK